MKWFRMYSEVLHDPKVQRLTPAMFKHWVNLLCLANDCTPRGVLPSTDDIAFALRIKPQEAARIVADLVKLQLLELTPDGRAIPHNWTERQRNSDDVAARVARHRAKDTPQSPPPQGTNHKATNGYVTLHEPLPVTIHTPQSNVPEEDIEQNRSDSIENTPAPAPKGSKLTPGVNAPKPTPATALSRDWAFDPGLREWAINERGLTPDQADDEHDSFCAYYFSMAHDKRRGWRSDWAAVEHGWFLKREQFTPKQQKGNTTNGTHYQTADERKADTYAQWANIIRAGQADDDPDGERRQGLRLIG